MQFLDGTREGVEELELTRPREDLIMPLEVKQDRNTDTRGGVEGACRCLKCRIHVRA
jgi:hypothetical protein